MGTRGNHSRMADETRRSLSSGSGGLFSRMNTRLNTSQLRAENFSGDLKTEVDRLQVENNALWKSTSMNRIAILVLALFSLVIWSLVAGARTTGVGGVPLGAN